MSNGYGRDDLTGADLSAIQADDALLDALGGSDPKVAAELGEAELNALLLSWSREVDSEPMPELVDVDTAVTTIRAATVNGRSKYERRRKLLVPVAAAAAVLGVTFGGASIAARDAQPGDTLWGLTKVLYADKASSVQASYDVQADFKIARGALEAGDVEKARDALEKAEIALKEVDEEENRDGLEQQHQELEDQLGGDTGGTEGPDSTPGDDPSSDPAESSTTTSPDPSTDPSTSTPPPSSTSPAPSTEPSTSESTSTNEASPSGSTSREDDELPPGDVYGAEGTEGDSGAGPDEPVG